LVRNLPIGSFGAVMGLAGLGLTARAAMPLFPGVFRAPAYFTELWVALGGLAFVGLLAAYLYKAAVHIVQVRAEFSNIQTVGFRAALPVGATLVAGGLAPYAPAVAGAVWWAGVTVLVALQLWALGAIALRRVPLGQVNPSWLILFVGGIVVPSSGIALGHGDASRLMFGVSAFAAPVIFALLAYRVARKNLPLPAPLRPSWFILLVPPSLIYANGMALFPGTDALEYLFFAALAVLAGLLAFSRQIARAPFSPVWWSLTFPLDALAYAAARYAQSHPSAGWQALAGAALVAATLCVTLVLLKNLHWLFATPRSAPSQGA
jgi:tellurite resistance protein